MYRSGWGTKAGQERVLAVEITREGFDEWALANSCLSSYEPEAYESREAWAACKVRSPVRVQWDPERYYITLAPLPYCAIQVRLSGEAVRRYVEEWIVNIYEATEKANELRALLLSGGEVGARALLPQEKPYPLPEGIKTLVAAS